MLQGFLQNPQQFMQMFQQGQPASMNQQLSNVYMNQLGQQNPGMDVVNAAQPIHQRNVQQGADMLRQAGPRFASNTERLVADQGQKANQDFNLFQQQVLESGLQRQLQAAGQAGQFSLGQQGLNQQAFQNMFGNAFGAGVASPALIQNPGGFANAMNVLGTVGGIASNFIPGGAVANAARGAFGGGGGGQPSPFGGNQGFQPPAPGSGGQWWRR